jgi:hypothetical protein
MQVQVEDGLATIVPDVSDYSITCLIEPVSSGDLSRGEH